MRLPTPKYHPFKQHFPLFEPSIFGYLHFRKPPYNQGKPPYNQATGVQTTQILPAIKVQHHSLASKGWSKSPKVDLHLRPANTSPTVGGLLIPAKSRSTSPKSRQPVAKHKSVQLCLHLSICLSVYLSICLSVYLSICLSIYLSIGMCIFIYSRHMIFICVHI